MTTRRRLTGVLGALFLVAGMTDLTIVLAGSLGIECSPLSPERMGFAYAGVSYAALTVLALL
jgi:hypothetical protein